MTRAGTCLYICGCCCLPSQLTYRSVLRCTHCKQQCYLCTSGSYLADGMGLNDTQLKWLQKRNSVEALSQNIFISLITIYKGTPNNGPLEKQLQLSSPSKVTICKVWEQLWEWHRICCSRTSSGHLNHEVTVIWALSLHKPSNSIWQELEQLWHTVG